MGEIVHMFWCVYAGCGELICVCVCVLSIQAGDRAVDAQRVLEDVGKTHLRAKDLDTEAKNLLKKILGKKNIPVYSPFYFLNLIGHLCLSLSILSSFFLL